VLEWRMKHYKSHTFKAISSIYVISIVALSGRSWLETLAALYPREACHMRDVAILS
jgi:hypothetical protein